MGIKRIIGGLGLVLLFLFRETVAWVLGQILNRFALPRDRAGQVDLSLLPWGNIVAWCALLIGIALIASGALKGRHIIGEANAAEPNEEKNAEEEKGPADQTQTTLSDRIRRSMIDPDHLHVGEAGVSGNNLVGEHWLEFWFRLFNASDQHIAISSVYGTIQCAVVVGNSAPENLKFELPPPSLMRDRSDLTDIPAKSETIIVLQQFLTPPMVKKLRNALEKQNGAQFFFDNLGILITATSDKGFATALPIPMGVSLRKEGDTFRTGRITRLSVNAVTSGSAA